MIVGALLAGCGGSSSHVCTVRPSANGQGLVYSPPGCQHDLKHETLNVETTPAP